MTGTKNKVQISEENGIVHECYMAIQLSPLHPTSFNVQSIYMPSLVTIKGIVHIIRAKNI